MAAGLSQLIPLDVEAANVSADGHTLRLSNLRKIYWPQEGYTKGDLLSYYATISRVLLPHIASRAMVMKRYPNGIAGKFFFMKRTPAGSPEWLSTCSIEHASGNVIDFPVVRDLSSLLWVVNLGCIDLNPWYARCDDVDRPDYLHFDLDPVEGSPAVRFEKVVRAAVILRDFLGELGMECFPKTSGSRGLHVYVPIVRGPLQKQVWTFAKSVARTLAKHEPSLVTAEYRISKRPAGRVLVDYNQNAWGRTLASVYSVRPRPGAPVSAPVAWDELISGAQIMDFRMDNMPPRVAKIGDLWARVAPDAGSRFELRTLMET